ncbi:hypothetical protein D3C76_668350 [compost metagenome]
MLHHGAQRHQPDAGEQYNRDPPQHSTFLPVRIATGLPCREQVHDLPKKGKQPGFVDRHTGTEQRKQKDITAGASHAGPQEPHQADRRWWSFVGGKWVEPLFKHAKHCGLRIGQREGILPFNGCFAGLQVE